MKIKYCISTVFCCIAVNMCVPRVNSRILDTLELQQIEDNGIIFQLHEEQPIHPETSCKVYMYIFMII
jgi:hypothetical protein